MVDEREGKDSIMNQILLIEDDLSLNKGISYKLNKEAYQVYSCAGVKEAR